MIASTIGIVHIICTYIYVSHMPIECESSICCKHCPTKYGIPNSMIVRKLIKWSSNRLQSSAGGCRYFGNSEKPHTPKLTPRSRKDVFVLTFGAAAAATYLWFSNDVEQDLQIAVDVLLRRREEGMKSDWEVGQDVSEDLPPPVKRFLDEALPVNRNLRRRQILSVTKQSGEFLAARKWYPFEASLRINDSFGDPCFVWHATTTIFGMPQQILQTLLGGRGSITTKAWGKIPTVQVQEEEPFILFWLAMLPLCPQALIQNLFEHQHLEWAEHDFHTARARLITYPDQEEYHLEFHFDEMSNLLQSIAVTSNCLEEQWKVVFRDYGHFRDDLVAPSRIEIGKGSGPRFRYHMTFVNKSIQ